MSLRLPEMHDAVPDCRLGLLQLLAKNSWMQYGGGNCNANLCVGVRGFKLTSS